MRIFKIDYDLNCSNKFLQIIVGCEINMFCCQSSFSRREHDKSLLKNVLSESEQNLNKFKFENSSLYFSEPNIFETKTESGERRKWKTSAEIGFHVDSLPKFKTKFNKREVNESGTQVALRKNRYDLYNLLKRKATSAEAVITPHRSEIIREKDNKTLDTSSLNSFLSSDVLFLNTQNNEIVNSSQEFYKEKKDYDSAEKGFEDVRSEFKKSHLKRKIGFKSHKPAKNESILDDVNAYKNTSETFENDVLHKNESVINFAELSDARVLQRVSSKFDVSCKSNLNHVNEFLKETDNKLAKAKSRKLKQEKLNSGTLFLSFCSLFHLPKASNEGSEKTYSKNNKINFKESYARLASQQNVEDNQSDFCPVGCQKNVKGRFTDRNVRISVENAPLIIKPPKFRNEEQEFFHQNESNDKKDFSDCRNDSLCRHDSRIDYLQSDVVAPGATQFRGTNFASSKRSNESVEEVSADEERIMSVIPKDDSSNESQLQIPTTILKACLRVKHRLLLDGDVQVCYLNHKRTVLNKVLTSKFLRKWETHHIILGDDSICSKTVSAISVNRYFLFRYKAQFLCANQTNAFSSRNRDTALIP